jgi:anti-sigma-K factor RskA
VEHVDELIAGYALHSLDPEDERVVDEHVAQCERCRVQLREMEAVAVAIAFTAPGASPPPELRSRVMDVVDQSVVYGAPPEPEPEPRPRWSWWPRFAAIAVPALAIAVIALGIWNISLRGDVNDAEVRAVDPVSNVGNVVSYSGGHAALFGSLQPAASGHTYEAWVIPKGQTVPEPAGTFSGGDQLSFTLTRSAAPGDTIVITLEPGQGGTTPTGPAVGKGTLS